MTPSIDIFIRTYRRDFPLLQYCLYSIFKYVTSFRKVVIAVREKEYSQLVDILKHKSYFTKLVISKEYNFDDSIDYLGQQITKLHADVLTDAEYIMFVDSDCVFYDSFDISLLMFDQESSRIRLRVDAFSNIDSSALIWKEFLKECKLPSEYEFMRRLPLLYPASLLKQVRTFISQQRKKTAANACLHIYHKTLKTFSEFNLLGAYAHTYEPTLFRFIYVAESDAETPFPMKQIQHTYFGGSITLQMAEMRRLLHL